MSFVGGGSDLPVFYRKFGGAVVSTAIDKYVYVTVNKKFDEKIRVSYSRTEEAGTVEKVKHPLVREAMKMTGIDGGVEITSIADIPARGSGLGSSSAFTVGVLHALHAHVGRYASADRLARESCEIEIEKCGEPIGKQDQYAAAYGGLNFIQFNQDDSVSVEPIICQRDTLLTLKRSILMFYTGITRSASTVLKNQKEAVQKEKKKQQVLRGMVQLAKDLKGEIQRNNTSTFGEILHENWELKRSLIPEISSSQIDHWYRKARKAGAAGGKLLGAGSGGFLMFFSPPETHPEIITALSDLKQVPVSLEPQGSRIIFIHD